ncbi:hypothetical protein NQ318_019133 [Aromia moschata]|uniref:Uncharacterized protein n=1 Tax=Aromia moschata TaxID=1265417 RepID=A0AAV8YPP7_9CUCU|nr:hypothetical protein NQ318_019133 [Aromia moschata]
MSFGHAESPQYLEEICFRISQKLERDLHGEGGGGVPLAFTNPTLNVSSTSINHKHKHDEVVGSSEFIVIDHSTKKTTALEALKSIGPWAKRKARNAFLAHNNFLD